MIRVDTSACVDHLRSADAWLVKRLEANRVLMHPFVLRDLACGNLHRRQERAHTHRLGNEGDDPHLGPALWAAQRERFVAWVGQRDSHRF